MNKNKYIAIFFLAVLIISCSDDNSNVTGGTGSSPLGDKELVDLELEYEGTVYQTTMNGINVSNSSLFPFLAEEIQIKSFEISQNATTSISIGQKFIIDESPFYITVTAEDNSYEDYKLSLVRDKGMQLEPNADIESGSSYALQVSDVYVDGWQLDYPENNGGWYINTYADFNNDGHTDVLLAYSNDENHQNYGSASFYHGDGTAVNQEFCEAAGECDDFSRDGFALVENALPEDFQGLVHPRKVINGDYNNDGLMDAFLIGHGLDESPFPGESPILLLNKDGSSFNEHKFTSQVGFYHGGASGDIDNDGDEDIFVVDGSGQHLFLINSGAGDFTIENTTRLDEGYFGNGGYYTGELIDINQDGFMDLTIAGHEHEENPTTILWGSSYGKYIDGLRTVLPEVAGYGVVLDIDAEDIDNDGDRDLILNRTSSSNGFYERYYVQILENNNNKSFSDVSDEVIPDNQGEDWYTWIRLQDLNDNGDIDIYMETNQQWLNDGNGNFTRRN